MAIKEPTMIAYDWLMALGVIAIAGIVVKGLWAWFKTEAIDQPDNWPPGGGDGHGSGGHGFGSQ